MKRPFDRTPRRPSDPRPGGRPYYIAPTCDNCGAALVLNDVLRGTSARQVWHDEWTCPTCRDGIYLDWPPAALQRLTDATARVVAETPD